MKSTKGFTLLEFIAVSAVIAIILVLAFLVIMPLIDKSRLNSFGDEVIKYASAAETKYETDGIDDVYKDLPEDGICYSTSELKGEYVQTKKSFKGIVILKADPGTHDFKKYAYITSNVLFYNSTKKQEKLSDKKQLKKISIKEIQKGNDKKLTYATCCDYYKSIDPTFSC